MIRETDEEMRARWARNAAPVSAETREQMIARWEASGDLDPTCKGCRERYESPKMPCDVFMPSHKAMPFCRSGKHPHCTCDTCF